MILKSCVAHEVMETLKVDDSFFKRVREENRGKVHEVTLMAVCDHPTGETMTSEVFGRSSRWDLIHLEL